LPNVLHVVAGALCCGEVGCGALAGELPDMPSGVTVHFAHFPDNNNQDHFTVPLSSVSAAAVDAIPEIWLAHSERAALGTNQSEFDVPDLE
jgi:hypothetical protein